MNPRLLRTILIAASAFLTTAQADHMSVWGPGWANMPNDIHNTRIETRLEDDNDAFWDFVRYGEGADSTNQYLEEETAAVESELDAGHQVDQLAARLNPLLDYLGGGWARYTLFDGDTLVSRVLNINVRLRLVTKNGADANEELGLDDGANTVAAWFRYATADANLYYAMCGLVSDGVIDTDGDGVGDYAVYSLSLKEDPAGLIEGTGGCVDTADTADAQMLPDVLPGDIVEIAVDGFRPVLQGDF